MWTDVEACCATARASGPPARGRGGGLARPDASFTLGRLMPTLRLPDVPIVVAVENRAHQDGLQLLDHSLITGQPAFLAVHGGLKPQVRQCRRAQARAPGNPVEPT